MRRYRSGQLVVAGFLLGLVCATARAQEVAEWNGALCADPIRAMLVVGAIQGPDGNLTLPEGLSLETVQAASEARLPDDPDLAYGVVWNSRHERGPHCLLQASAWRAQSNLNEAIELRLIAVARALYEVQRCEDEQAFSYSLGLSVVLDAADYHIRDATGPDAAEALDITPISRRVFNDERTFSAPSPLHQICEAGVRPRQDWPDILSTLRTEMEADGP